MSIETFASPMLRWGLLISDHPGASHSFDLKTGEELDIPEEFGRSGKFCVCTIKIPGRENVVAWKPTKNRGDADEWNITCTKTLGRALKRAGYPDDLNDLKSLMWWNREVAKIHGTALAELGAGETPLQIEATTGAGQAYDPDDTVIEPDEDDITDAEVEEDEPVAEEADEDKDDDLRETVIADVKALPPELKEELKEFLAAENLPERPDEWDDFAISEIDAWLAADE